jgi:hypothetical protein
MENPHSKWKITRNHKVVEVEVREEDTEEGDLVGGLGI